MKYSGKDRKVSKNIAVKFAGGSGIRMGSGMPKQFLKINGQPIIIYTLEIFEDSPDIDEIYIACKEDYISKMKKYIWLTEVIVGIFNRKQITCSSICPLINVIYHKIGSHNFIATVKNVFHDTLSEVSICSGY